ncbi:MAG: hypothetical protein KAV82_11810 [Phycisphaerae bacterium]|nr:hypothetical protein [Phycisphaerae bacterium]
MSGEQISQHDANIIAALAKVEGKVDGMSALLEAFKERTRDDTNALFRFRKEHAATIGKIERDYVPRNTFERHEHEQREDIASLRASIDGIKTQVTKVLAIGGVIYAILGVALVIWGKM